MGAAEERKRNGIGPAGAFKRKPPFSIAVYFTEKHGRHNHCPGTFRVGKGLSLNPWRNTGKAGAVRVYGPVLEESPAWAWGVRKEAGAAVMA